ncbi:FecR family protein [Cochleicola gelatinilyticus]|uniref:Uncharacterized protein n=1 Tax=Cochleicola gelatinilyticus TaxID=1763537 RepID=A0A167KG50_9FLAO|nr:FecR domain-containing protein [Cochleicola gelatinilyticus]OAB81857.1 hypothetical protein ULVI_00550 [Cochleicola gelatinilyticus]
MNEKLHKKWLNGTLSEAEQKSFEQSPDYPIAKKITEEAKRFKASQFESRDDFEIFDPREPNNTTAKVPVKKLNWKTIALRIAAIFVLGAALYFLFNQNQTTTVATAIGQQETFSLPDASRVILNADSKLVYSKSDWEQERAVSLQGEAWFKVAKGKTFTVQTPYGSVTVLGTQFNVRQRANFFEVTCYIGLVKVTAQNKDAEVPAGTSYRLLNEHAEVLEISQRKPDWTKFMSSFTNVPIRLVFEELETQYPIKIIDQSNKGNEYFTGSFTHTDLRTALRALTDPMNLTFEINKDQTKVYIHGD